jgi:diguanylate cyclase
VDGSASGVAHSRRWSVDGRRLTGWTGLVAGVVVAVGLCFGIGWADDVRASPVWFVVAVLAFAAAQWARLPVRIGGSVVQLAWGEVGLVTALCVVPLVWVPVAVLLGAGLGHWYRLRGADRAHQIRVVCAMAGVTAGGIVATCVVAVVDPAVRLTAPSAAPVRIDVTAPVSMVPLLLAAITYFLVTSALTAAWITGGRPAGSGAGRGAAASSGPVEGLGPAWVRLARAKRLLLTGNVVAALAVAVVLAVDVRWTLLLVPVLVALHRTYLNRHRATGRLDSWGALVGVTLELGHRDEPSVARAALHGAAELFAPDEVELVLDQPGGRLRYVQVSALPNWPRWSDRSNWPRWSDRPNWLSGTGRSAAGPTQLVRPLGRASQPLGEIRLGFRRPGRLTGAQLHAFSAFADAVSSALHDAASARLLRAITARSAFDAVHDPLTGLSTRSTLLARGDAHLRQAAPGPVVALILIDIDGFRAINEALGLAAGDELLRVLSARLAGACGPDDLLGRLGADEFAVLLTNPAGRRSLSTVDACSSTLDSGRGRDHPVGRAQALIALLSTPVEIQGGRVAVAASAGVVQDAVAGCDMSELLRRAGSALRQAKVQPGRVARYDPTPDPAVAARIGLLADFRDALTATDQLSIELQPTIDLVTGRPVGAEALVRWDHPVRGRLVAADFVPAIASTELATGLTRRVLDLALAVAAGWPAAGIRVPLSVNLSPRDVDPSLPGWLTGRLASHGVAADRLTLELTESVGTDTATARAVLAELRAGGVRISLDNFGTGSASWSFLTQFAVDEVKIDRSFVATFLDSPETAAIVAATVDLARRLGLRVVAGGIERPDQSAALIGLGVTVGQGLLLYPPLPVAEATEVLSRAVDQPVGPMGCIDG